jgi:hypothetical protein
MDPLLGVFRSGKLRRLASVKDTHLRRTALRAFAEPQTHIIVDIPDNLVSSKIVCVDTNNTDIKNTHFRCVLLEADDGKCVPVYAANASPPKQQDVDMTWHALAVASCVSATSSQHESHITLLDDGCLALTCGDMLYRSRASADNLAHTLPLSTHEDTQLLADEINENGAWSSETELRHRLATRCRSAIRADNVMEDLRHVMHTPGFTSCFSAYDAAYATALKHLMKLNNEKALAQDTAFCNELFARTTSVLVRAMAMPVPDSAFHSTRERTLADRVYGGTDCQPHRWLRWYMRVHAQLQRDFQARLAKQN